MEKNDDDDNSIKCKSLLREVINSIIFIFLFLLRGVNKSKQFYNHLTNYIPYCLQLSAQNAILLNCTLIFEKGQDFFCFLKRSVAS